VSIDDSVPAVVARLIDVLDASGETYAFGGAMDASRIDDAFALVRRAGVSLDEVVARNAARERGMFAGRIGATRVDVFVPSIPFYDEAARRRVRTVIGTRETWVHSAEVLAVFKMLFFRPKDLIDVERMLEVRGATFDRAFVRASLLDMLGDDERIAKWDAISARVSR
jgi:hypothetical protein